MTLAQLEYFVTAARERSFTKAAGKLFITQQSLSSSIAALERELGCELFVRHIPLELTYAGTVFLKQAKDILSRVETARQELCDIAGDRSGVLRIGIASTRGKAVLPDIIAAFGQRYPGISIVIKEGTNEGLRRSISEGDIDIALAGFAETEKSIAVRDFYREEVMLFASDGLLERCFESDKSGVVERLLKGELAELWRCPFVLGTPKDIAGHIAADVLATLPAMPPIPVRAENVETLLTLCVKGVGLCFCPVVLAETSLPNDVFCSLYRFSLGDVGKYDIRFGYRNSERVWSVTEAFMDIAAQTFSAKASEKRISEKHSVLSK